MKKYSSFMVNKVEPQNIMVFIKKLGRPVFTTHELTAISGKLSADNTSPKQNFGNIVINVN